MEKAAAYINRATSVVPVLREIAALESGIAAGRIADFRDEESSGGYVCLTASGLVILGKIVHELFKNHSENWEDFDIEPLRHRRDADRGAGRVVGDDRDNDPRVTAQSGDGAAVGLY